MDDCSVEFPEYLEVSAAHKHSEWIIVEITDRRIIASTTRMSELQFLPPGQHPLHQGRHAQYL